MSTYISLTIFLALYAISSYWDGFDKLRRDKVLMFLAITCVLVIGLRNPAYWIDTWAYVESFKFTKTLASFSFNDSYLAYSEKGYYLLCVIIKTFSSQTFVYLTVVGGALNDVSLQESSAILYSTCFGLVHLHSTIYAGS